MARRSYVLLDWREDEQMRRAAMRETERVSNLWEYLNNNDDFPPISTWPSHRYNELKQIMLMHPSKRGNKKTFRLGHFLLMNGLRLNLYHMWMRMYDAPSRLGPRLWSDNAPRAVLPIPRELQVHQILTQFLNSELDIYPYWSLYHGRKWGTRDWQVQQELRRSGIFKQWE